MDEEEAEELQCDVQKLEAEDRTRLNQVRSVFYHLNERFEQLLKFKPVRSVKSYKTSMNLDAAYEMMNAFKIDEETESFEEHIKSFEQQLDLKDYYDIKRPIALFFTQSSSQKTSTLTVSRFDLLCEKGSGAGFDEGSISTIKVLGSKNNHK